MATHEGDKHSDTDEDRQLLVLIDRPGMSRGAT
jgi:hypothetical protein